MPARDLYNKILIDHFRSTEHRGVPDSFTHSGTGYNHNCGDEITVYLTVRGETIEDASFVGKGCMICQASASMLAGEVKGKSVVRALGSISHLNQLIKGEAEPEVKLEKGSEVEVEIKFEKGIEYEAEIETGPENEVEKRSEVEAENVTGPEIEVEKGSKGEVQIEIDKGSVDEGETGSRDYIALSMIREFPMRIKCATLAWETAAKLLQSSGSEITSE